MNIPRTMSTQHPDNVSIPFFASSSELGGEDEIQEAYYAFSHLQCTEQMWDCEGKEVDNYVVKKLLSRYDNYFKEKIIGEDIFITLRVPNPLEEKAEAKILLETLESIPRSFDVAKLFYSNGIAPIFEVILPMAKSSKALNRIFNYYKDFVVGKEKIKFSDDDITISQWIGDFYPKSINVIPLFEDMEHMLNAANITENYLFNKNLPYQRVFLARSDPALNYGLISAVLLNKIALQRLHKLSKRIGIPIYPILGVGSAPFRGNLKPSTVDNVMAEYPFVQTFTIQSAFKYDNHPDEIMKAIRKLNSSTPSESTYVDEKRALDIINRYSTEYKNQIVKLAPIINKISQYIPQRRKRKLHVGLFGYSRSVGEVSLPRAIKFTASLYSLGLPPELLGLNALLDEDVRFLKDTYVNFGNDLRDSLRFFNPDTPFATEELKRSINNLDLYDGVDKVSLDVTNTIIKKFSNNDFSNIKECILRAANARKFLG